MMSKRCSFYFAANMKWDTARCLGNRINLRMNPLHSALTVVVPKMFNGIVEPYVNNRMLEGIISTFLSVHNL
jgi:hypothetical protein